MLSPFKRATQKAATILNFMLISQDVEKIGAQKSVLQLRPPNVLPQKEAEKIILGSDEEL